MFANLIENNRFKTSFAPLNSKAGRFVGKDYKPLNNAKNINMIYEILEAETAKELELETNRKLADGWELYGNLVSAIKADTSVVRSGIAFAVEAKIILFQAVIKNEPAKK